MIHRAPLSRKASTSSLSSLYSARRSSAVSCSDLMRLQDSFKRKRSFSNNLLTLLLLCSCPLLFLYHYIVQHFLGSIKEALKVVLFTDYLIETQITIVSVLFPLILVCFHILLQSILPTELHTILNYDGTYQKQRLNSFTCSCFFTLFYILGSGLKLYEGDIVFVHWIPISFFNSLVILLILLITIGRNHIKHQENTSLLSDLFFGINLSPKFLDIDIKKFVTHQLATSLWLVYIISALLYAKKNQKQLNDTFICVSLLQIAYIFKFLWNEHLFYSNLDAQNDRMGFYRTWGVIVFIPTIYTTPVTIAANLTKSMNPFFYNFTVFGMGLFAITMTYYVDSQKYNFRFSRGRYKIMGKDPFFIVAKSRKENGDIQTSLLLGSGFWGITRKINYSFEWLTIISWILLLGKATPLLGLFPVLFITIFLIGRALRDEQRCLQKYGNYWVQYCHRVPFVFIPGVY
uniref:7-dehydrocholesterol reductase n=1 Tax=Strongyloides stercoralis TaxID=6248 RepID=A0A0K0E3R1_STRER